MSDAYGVAVALVAKITPIGNAHGPERAGALQDGAVPIGNTDGEDQVRRQQSAILEFCERAVHPRAFVPKLDEVERLIDFVQDAYYLSLIGSQQFMAHCRCVVLGFGVLDSDEAESCAPRCRQ